MSERPTPTLERTDLTNDIGWALGTAFRAYLRSTGAEVQDIPGGPRGYQVLVMGSSPACSNQSTIANELGIDRTVMTYLLDDLERADLVVRRPDPADRRSRQVLLTDAGRAKLATVQSRLIQVERDLLGALTDDEAAAFKALLYRVAAGTGSDLPKNACSVAEEVLPTP